MVEGSSEVRDVVIFDLDGTLALIEHRTHLISGPDKDWKAFYQACDKDEPYEAVCAMARALKHCGYKIWVVSGREDSVRSKTLAWMDAIHIMPDQVLMRPEGCYDTDTVLKKRWMETVIPMDRVLCVYEDRQSVVDMWREHGVPCFQVQPGNF